MNYFFQDDAPLDCTFWIDVCPVNANLVVAGGANQLIQVYDRRSSAIVLTFGDIHSGKGIFYLRLSYEFCLLFLSII